MKWNSIKLPTFCLSGLLGAAWTIFLFNQDLQLRAPGYGRLSQIAITFLILLILFYWLFQYLMPLIIRLPAQHKISAFLFSFVFAGLLIFMLPIKMDKYFYALLPTHKLTVYAESGLIDQVNILQFTTSSGLINPAEILHSQEERLSWQGKVGNKAALAFKPLDQPTHVIVEWDGIPQSFDLSSTTKHNVVFANNFFSISWVQSFLWFFAVWLALTSAVLTGTILLVSINWKPGREYNHWLWYTIPMIITWMMYLFVFWPGLMSPDSIMQWGEVQTGIFSDAHPAIHTMLIWVLSRLWNTPAVLVIFHILLLSLISAWGLGELQKQHVSAIFIWAGALLFALLPINGLLVISVWKDITYACALFAFFLQFVKIFLSNGKWLENNWNLAGLILAGITAAVVRHNGLPVVLGSLLLLPFVFQNSKRNILVVLTIFFFLWAGIQGPLYSTLNVKRYPGFGNILFLDHINAHIHAGTHLNPDEKTFIESLLPLNAWPYYCADSDIRKMDGPIPFDYFTQATTEPARITINLFLRNPMVDIEHTLCASALVWKVNTDHYLSVVSVGQNEDGTFGWVSENTLGVSEQSLFPGLISFLASQNTDKSLFSKPAFYLLIAIFSFFVVSLRQPGKKVFLISTPLFFQTSVMLLVIFAQDFRYLYSTVLIALFCLVLRFLQNPSLAYIIYEQTICQIDYLDLTDIVGLWLKILSVPVQIVISKTNH